MAQTTRSATSAAAPAVSFPVDELAQGLAGLDLDPACKITFSGLAGYFHSHCKLQLYLNAQRRPRGWAQQAVAAAQQVRATLFSPLCTGLHFATSDLSPVLLELLSALRLLYV